MLQLKSNWNEEIKDKTHIEQVGFVYEDLKIRLNLLFNDLNPAPWNVEPINSRIEAIYELLTALRNLACINPAIKQA